MSYRVGSYNDLDKYRYCHICFIYSDQPHHSHECRDCGADIECHGEDRDYYGCVRWGGGNDRCPNPDCHEVE